MRVDKELILPSSDDLYVRTDNESNLVAMTLNEGNVYSIISGTNNGEYRDISFSETDDRYMEEDVLQISGAYVKGTEVYMFLKDGEVKILKIPDNSGPELTGIFDRVIKYGEAFNPRQGVKAFDVQDGDITENIKIKGKVVNTVSGTYELIYSITNSRNLTSTNSCKVTVKDLNAPEITGAYNKTVLYGSDVNLRRGVRAYDVENGDLTKDIKIDGTVNTFEPGDHEITYRVSDKDGNTAEVTIIITVLKKFNTPPVINCSPIVTVKVNDDFKPYEGVTAYDDENNDITEYIELLSEVSTAMPGTYPLTYIVFDKNKLFTKKTRILIVTGTVKGDSEDGFVPVENNEITVSPLPQQFAPISVACKFTPKKMAEKLFKTTILEEEEVIKNPIIKGAKSKTIYVNDDVNIFDGIIGEDEIDGIISEKVYIKVEKIY